MAGTISYVDIGALQRKEGGSPTAGTSYVDIGAAQRQEASSGPPTRYILIRPA
jgi:hypothetical protein